MGSCSNTASIIKSATKVDLSGVDESNPKLLSAFSRLHLPLVTAISNCSLMYLSPRAMATSFTSNKTVGYPA